MFEPTHSENLDYGMVGPSGTLEAEPGLWLHVVKVASIQADFALNELLAGSEARPTYPANTIILANAAMEILDGQMSPPHSSLWVNVQRDPYCLVCGDEVYAENADEAADLSLADLAGSAGITLQDDD
jgi:hypothetical protein